MYEKGPAGKRDPVEELGRLRQTGRGFEEGGGRERNPPPSCGTRAVRRGGQTLKEQAGAGGDLQLKDTEPGGVERAEALRSGQPPSAQPRGRALCLGRPRAPSPAWAARARLWHEIGCSRNESARRGGG